MNELTIHDYLQKKGLSEYGIAGLMGNLFAESGLNPRNLQNSYENVLGMNDNAYVAAVDNGTYTNFVQDKAGFLVLPALHQIVQELIGLFVGQHRLLSGRLIYRVLDLADD